MYWVDSAGTSNYHLNKAPDARSQKHALQRGYDLAAYVPDKFILEDFIEFDLILAMDHKNFDDISHSWRKRYASLVLNSSCQNCIDEWAWSSF